jgi:hypothetical protein
LRHHGLLSLSISRARVTESCRCADAHSYTLPAMTALPAERGSPGSRRDAPTGVGPSRRRSRARVPSLALSKHRFAAAVVDHGRLIGAGSGRSRETTRARAASDAAARGASSTAGRRPAASPQATEPGSSSRSTNSSISAERA